MSIGQQGIRQADIPKMRKFLAEGKTAEEIANGMLGYKAPVSTIQSFIPGEEKPKKKAVKRTPQHPQDRKAAVDRATIEAAERAKE